MALVVNLTRIKSPIISDCNRLCWTLGSQVRRVLCFENGTLFPYCFILPWNKPCWDRLKGWDITSHNALLGNIGDGEKPMYELYICACLPLTPDFLPWSPARHHCPTSKGSENGLWSHVWNKVNARLGTIKVNTQFGCRPNWALVNAQLGFLTPNSET